MKKICKEKYTKEQLDIIRTVLKTARCAMRDHLGEYPSFYTPQEWKERGEEYGTESELVVVHDGGYLAPYFNWDYCCYGDVERMGKALGKIGYFAEQCTCWYSAVYRQ